MITIEELISLLGEEPPDRRIRRVNVDFEDHDKIVVIGNVVIPSKGVQEKRARGGTE